MGVLRGRPGLNSYDVPRLIEYAPSENMARQLNLKHEMALLRGEKDALDDSDVLSFDSDRA